MLMSFTEISISILIVCQQLVAALPMMPPGPQPPGLFPPGPQPPGPFPPGPVPPGPPGIAGMPSMAGMPGMAALKAPIPMDEMDGILNGFDCSMYPTLMNVAGKYAFQSGGTNFTFVFDPMLLIHAEKCGNIEIAIKIWQFGSETSEIVVPCKPVPLADNNWINCQAPNLTQFFSSPSDVLVIEPSNQFGGCEKESSICYSVIEMANDRQILFHEIHIPPFLADMMEQMSTIVKNQQSLLIYPDPQIDSATIDTTKGIVTVDGLNLFGDDPVAMSKLYAVTIQSSSSAAAAVAAIEAIEADEEGDQGQISSIDCEIDLQSSSQTRMVCHYDGDLAQQTTSTTTLVTIGNRQVTLVNSQL